MSGRDSNLVRDVSGDSLADVTESTPISPATPGSRLRGRLGERTPRMRASLPAAVARGNRARPRSVRRSRSKRGLRRTAHRRTASIVGLCATAPTARGAHPATPNPVAAVDSVRPEISVLRETVKYVGDSFWFGDHEIVARVDFPHLVGIEEPVLRSLNTSPESLRAVNNRSRDALHAFRVGQA